MKDIKEKNITAFLLKNTRTKKRVQNLFEFAHQLEQLKNKLGGIKNIEKIYSDISANMLNRFLSVLKVHPKVQELIKQGEINNINAIYYMHTLPFSDQIYLSKLLVDGKINSTDIRALRPLKKKFPEVNIEALMQKVLKSKDIKNYLIKFDLLDNEMTKRVTNKLKAIIDTDDFTLAENRNIGTITLTSAGIKKLRRSAKQDNKTFKRLIEEIINK